MKNQKEQTDKRLTITKLPKDSVNLFWDWLKDNEYSYNTREVYERYVIRTLLSDKEDRRLSPSKIWDFMVEHNSTYGKAAIKKFLEFLEFKYNISIDKVRYPKLKKKDFQKTHPLIREEINLLVESMPDVEGMYKFKLPSEVLARTGIRISEVVSMRIKNIDFISWQKDETKNGFIDLTKTKGDYPRTIQIKPDLMVKLMEQCVNPKNPEVLRDIECFVFDFRYDKTMWRYRRQQLRNEKLGLHYYDKSLWDIKYIEKSVAYFKKVIRRTAIEVLKKPTRSHIFRHSFLTYLDSIGVKPHIIQRTAGHKSFNTTSKYLHPSEKDMSVTAI